MQLPNFTQTSNEFISQMSRFSGSAVKVFLAISRKTIGWHKESDRISYSQLGEMTGISSHHSLKKATEDLAEAGFITISGDEKRGYTYDLNLTMAKSATESSAKSAIDSEKTMAKSATTKETVFKETNKTNMHDDVFFEEVLKEMQPGVKDTADTKKAVQSLTADFGGGEGVEEYLYFVNKKAVENAKSNVPAFFVKAVHNRWYLDDWKAAQAEDKKYCSKCGQTLIDGRCLRCSKEKCPACGEEMHGKRCGACDYLLGDDIPQHKEMVRRREVIEKDPEGEEALKIKIEDTERFMQLHKQSGFGNVAEDEKKLKELHIKLSSLQANKQTVPLF